MSKRQLLKREVNDTKGHPTLYIQNKLTRPWQKNKNRLKDIQQYTKHNIDNKRMSNKYQIKEDYKKKLRSLNVNIWSSTVKCQYLMSNSKFP